MKRVVVTNGIITSKYEPLYYVRKYVDAANFYYFSIGHGDESEAKEWWEEIEKIYPKALSEASSVGKSIPKIEKRNLKPKPEPVSGLDPKKASYLYVLPIWASGSIYLDGNCYQDIGPLFQEKPNEYTRMY